MHSRRDPRQSIRYLGWPAAKRIGSIDIFTCHFHQKPEFMIIGGWPNGAPIAIDIEAQRGTVWYLANETIRNRPLRASAINVVSRLILRCNVASKKSRVQLQPCIPKK